MWHHSRRSAMAMGKCTAWMVWVGLSALPCVQPVLAHAQPQQHSVSPTAQSEPPAAAPAQSSDKQLPEEQSPGRISGIVVDQTGAVVAGARVILTRDAHSLSQEVLTDEDGQFSFLNIAPG